ncbi:hypothetical protein GNE08_26185 [Trichormus variabilis ARAD]|uniref:Uncharacterized protein n=1 Tax=Trichormus variabilis N2B TaxID=2681315 RepID=A0ABR6S4F2_ANAVA|nr:MULTISPECIES: hypothetical protein [Nostocaceae]MBC1217688.1 hypothetical protein [Trichormus variabilis ARAD]MBC1259018.1 hypothetical protein [Trichormus variabilis V5]MBC1269215.1 hypothetical protein [Trichormus variabilis FSR]MBC1301274.1 hypothetical protein [Trichormus variabilis N2B]MBC1309788.1 hypothetical protein [Trichormus variabilis PNB]
MPRTRSQEQASYSRRSRLDVNPKQAEALQAFADSEGHGNLSAALATLICLFSFATD